MAADNVEDAPPPTPPPWWKEDFDLWRAALTRRSSLVWLLGLVSLGGFYVAHAVEGSIGRLHAPSGEKAASYRDLFFGKIHTSWDIWTDGVNKLVPFKIPGPGTFIRLHVAADMVFVIGGFVALMLFVRVDTDKERRKARYLWVLVLLGAFVADFVGNLFELGLSFWQSRWLSFPAGFAWWVAVILYTIGLLTVLVQGRHTISTRWRELLQAPAALRLMFGLSLAMTVLLLFSGKIGVQSEDLLERWFAGHWLNGLFTLIGLVLLTLAVAISRHLISKNDDHPRIRGLIVAGVVLIAAGILVRAAQGGYGVLVLGGILLATGLGSITKGAPHESATTSKLGNFQRRPPQLECDRAWLRLLVVALPVLSLSLVMLRSATNRLTAVGAANSPLLLPAAGALGLLFTYVFATFASAPALDPVEQAAMREKLAKRKQDRDLKALDRIDSDEADWLLAGVFAAVAVAVAVLLVVAANCTSLARQVGGLGVLTLALAGVAALGFAIRAMVSANTTPVAFSRLGFRRTPVSTLLVVWVVIASQLGGSTNNSVDHVITYYDVHLINASTGMKSAGAQPTTNCITDQPVTDDAKLGDVAIAFCRWLATAPAGANGRVPMVLVTAEGGGVRAAGWTAAVLDCLFLRQQAVGCGKSPTAEETTATANKMPFGHFASLFAANGASGGSVGIASVVAQRLSTEPTNGVAAGWIDGQLGGDPLGPTIARAIVYDSVLGLFGTYAGHDRARELELRWGEHWDKTPVYCDTNTTTPVSQLGYLALRDECDKPLPLMLFNGTNVSDGRRVDVAPFDINKPFESAETTVAYDLVDYVCGHDVELFTAAFMSARFPLISSSGRIAGCGGNDAINVVDGGYGENTGTAQIAEIWDQLSPIITAYNGTASHSTKLVVPVLLEIKTGEQGVASGPGHSATWGEFFRPLQAFLNVHAGRDSDAEELLVSSFEQHGSVDGTPAVHIVMQMSEHPGRTMPLGWTLSSEAIGDLYNQLAISTNTKRECEFSKLFDPSGC